MSKKINKFFTTPLGTFLKVFLSSMLVFIIQKGEISFNLNFLKSCINAGWIAVVPMLYNYFNPKYTLYGKKKDE